jgi:hypothetical protein
MPRIVTTYRNLRVINDADYAIVEVPEEHLLEALKLIHSFDTEAAHGEYSRSEDIYCEAYMSMIDLVAKLVGIEADGDVFLRLEYEEEVEFEV